MYSFNLMIVCFTCQAVGASHRIFELMDREPEIPIEGGRRLETINDGQSAISHTEVSIFKQRLYLCYLASFVYLVWDVVI